MKNGLVIATALSLQLILGADCRAQSTAADNFPNQTIKIITNVGVGGTYDILARALADELQKTLGKPVVIEPTRWQLPDRRSRLRGSSRRWLHRVRIDRRDGGLQRAALHETSIRSAQGFRADFQSDLQHAAFGGQRLAWSEIPGGLGARRQATAARLHVSGHPTAQLS